MNKCKCGQKSMVAFAI